jgi:hypothetical protein
VIGAETPLTIAGEQTSLGRLMSEKTVKVTVEATNVMLVSEVDGKTRKAVTALQLEGIALADVMEIGASDQFQVVDQNGKTVQLSADEARTGVLVSIRGVLTLVLPDRGRSMWIENVVEINKTSS